MPEKELKINFLVDGFNLYHSISSARACKWLDIKSLFNSYLYLLGSKEESIIMGDIFYFSALAYHLQSRYPDTVLHHKIYIRALESTGVIPVLGKFKKKDVHCNLCRRTIRKHEEKQTDVSIAVKILELCILSSCDIIGIVSGDTDLIPAINTAQELFPKKEIVIFSPGARVSKELKKTVKRTFNIKPVVYNKHSFPEQINHNGIIIKNPFSIKSSTR
jgi:uncharacterized LabA/DUF88 family protein